MISSLRGTVVHLENDAIVVEVGGVGFHVAVPAAVAREAHTGESIQLHTMLVVREDALSLYGFRTREELGVFGLLIGVSGVGPKSALGVLSHMSVPQIADAVAADDDAPFRRVSGIGPKTAKLLVVQLAGKLTAPAPSEPAAAAGTGTLGAQVVQALVGLGWSERVAVETLEQILAEQGDSSATTVPALLRVALAQLGPARKEGARG